MTTKEFEELSDDEKEQILTKLEGRKIVVHVGGRSASTTEELEEILSYQEPSEEPLPMPKPKTVPFEKYQSDTVRLQGEIDAMTADRDAKEAQRAAIEVELTEAQSGSKQLCEEYQQQSTRVQDLEGQVATLTRALAEAQKPVDETPKQETPAEPQSAPASA